VDKLRVVPEATPRQEAASFLRPFTRDRKGGDHRISRDAAVLLDSHETPQARGRRRRRSRVGRANSLSPSGDLEDGDDRVGGRPRQLDGWRGALDGLSPGVSSASSSSSLADKDGQISRSSSRSSLKREKATGGADSRRSGSAAGSQQPEEDQLKVEGAATTRVQFQVVAVTKPDEDVKVVGSIPALGCWQPHAAVRLTTGAATYPTWTATVEVQSGVPVDYKYMKFNRKTHEVIWEVDIQNRMFVPEGFSTVLEDGKFNVERARLLNKNKSRLEIDQEGRTSRYNEYTEMNVQLGAEDCVYIISFKLPLRVTPGPLGSGEYEFEWHAGFGTNTSSRHAGYVVEKLRWLRKKAQIWYIGWLGIDIPAEDREVVSETLKKDYQCLPVFLQSDVAADVRDFTDKILRPIFHFQVPSNAEMCLAFSQPLVEEPAEGWDPRGAGSSQERKSAPSTATQGENASAGMDDAGFGRFGRAGSESGVREDKPSRWKTYNTVNREFVMPLVERFNDQDIVWVVDTELLMVPAFVGARCRSANMGFVFNTPFPSSDIFRMLPARKEILSSLLNADMIMFHCFSYSRHFLTCCSRLLGLEYHSMRGGLVQLNFRGHHVHIRSSHVGMDASTFLAKLSRDLDFEGQRLRWQTLLGDRRVVLGYDSLEAMSGTLLLLQAFESMARLFPSIVSNVVLVLVAIPPEDNHGNELHTDYQAKVEAHVAAINLRHPGLVRFYPRRMEFTERTSLFSVADVLVNSAVRHGLNLVPFEFVLCSQTKKGGFVCSEFLGCSRALPGAVKASPWRDEDLARAIHKLLHQEAHERSFWHQLQVDFCKSNTVFSWAENSLLDMKKIRRTMIDLGEDTKRAGLRVGIAKMPHKEMSSNYLKVDQVYAAYSASQTRLLLVDIDLVLGPILRPDNAEGTSQLASKQEILRCLRNISERQGNFLFLLSSRTRDEILEWFGDISGLDNVGLAAEDGYWYKWPGSPLGRWDARVPVMEGWKEVAHGLMDQYTQRTNGSWIEDNKVSSITWHWSRLNPEFGSLQGKELQNHLQEMLSHFNVRIALGKQSVVVRQEGVTKGSIVDHIIKHYNSRGGVDFLLGLGDDAADEDMFKVISAYHRDAQYRVVANSQTVQEVKVFTCTVGRQPSTAAFCLYKAEEVLELMGGLFLLNKRARSVSMVELSANLGQRPLSAY